MSDPLLKRSFRGHKDAITSVSFNPNMKQIASGSQDSVVTVWNFKPQQRPFKFVGHKGPVYDVDFSPNGQVIASASKDETVRLWQNSIEGYSTTIKAHNGAVRSVNFSSDGKLLLTSSDDKTAKVWSAYDRKFLFTLAGHNNWVRTAHFSPDVRLIASGSDDKTVKIWDVGHKQELHTFYDHTGIVNTVKFHPDGTCIASGSHDKKIKIWDIRSKRLLQHYDAHADSVNQIAFHPSGFYLVSASSDSKLKVWDLRQGKLAYTLYGHEGECTAINFSQRGDYFGSGGNDNLVMVWKSNFEEQETEFIEDILEVKGTHSNKKTTTTKSLRSSTGFGSKRPESLEPKTLVYSPTKGLGSPVNSLKQSNKINKNETLKTKTHSEKNKLTQATSKTQKQQPENTLRSSDGFNKDKENEVSPAIQAYMNKLPELLSTSLDKIVNQLETITRSIQVLESKLGANEDQIAHLMQVVTNTKQSNKGETNNFMGSSFKIGNDNVFSYQSIQQSSARTRGGPQ